ncbi:hypothetical protein KR009_008028 [Drosophila setifemur]|nr:hypothetical protein KR009_008028 [Drosophila setifemur]
MSPPSSNCLRNYVYLAGNEDYGPGLSKLCERCALKEKRVLLITSRNARLTRRFQFEVRSKAQEILLVPDIEGTPMRLLDLHSSSAAATPDLIVFDLHALVMEVLQRPVMEQCSTDKLVRHVAKCAAAFANYRALLGHSTEAATKAIDTVVVMSQAPYPLTQAQFKLLIGLYFYGNECYTNFSKLAGNISVCHG